MSDNTVVLNPTAIPGGAGDTIATDDIGGVKYQRIKLIYGADGTSSGDVSSSNPLPIVVNGVSNSGTPIPLNATQEGHLEVAVHGPLLPFGSIHTEKLSPVFQVDGVYGINNSLVIATTGRAITGTTSASVSVSANLITCSTGTTSYSFASVQSRKRLRYRAGQGVVGRFAGYFENPVANCISVMGLGTAESGFYFAYNGPHFSILHSTNGVREVQTLTVTTPSTSTLPYAITLPDTTVVSVSATNNNSLTTTAYEISRGTYPGWKAAQEGSNVVFLSNDVGNKTNLITLSQPSAGTPAAGSSVETLAGAAATSYWIPQSSWNVDPLDGTGNSGYTLNPQVGNVYQIGVQYLGFGSVEFKIEIPFESNNPEFLTVHRLLWPGTSTQVHTSQPSYPFTAAASSAGSTTDSKVRAGSFAGFIEGDVAFNGPRMSYQNTATANTSTFTPLFTFRNALVFKNRANQSVVNLLSVSGAAKSTNGLTTFYLIRNATLTGPVNYTQFAPDSCTYWDTGATGCTYTTNDQVFWSAAIGESGQINVTFDQQIDVQPYETITLAVKSVTNTATVFGCLNTREDQ